MGVALDIGWDFVLSAIFLDFVIRIGTRIGIWDVGFLVFCFFDLKIT